MLLGNNITSLSRYLIYILLISSSTESGLESIAQTRTDSTGTPSLQRWGR